MTKYSVELRTDGGNAWASVDADTPKGALVLARKHDPQNLYFEPYPFLSVNEIIIYDGKGNDLAVWRDDECRLRVAARCLLQPLEAICDLSADDAGDRIVPAGLFDQARVAIALAEEG